MTLENKIFEQATMDTHKTILNTQFGYGDFYQNIFLDINV
jgi:hypothetical protein